jgi:mannobiose 2-epimerase
MMEASEILGIEHDEKTLARGKAMVDHVLDVGWDHERGGVYDRGYYLPDTEGMTIITESKAWWSQVEAMNTLLIMSELYPDDPRDYYDKFLFQWEYIKTYLLDPEYGGVLVEGSDIDPESRHRPKGGIWKVNYHTARSLMNCMQRLRHTAE